MKKINLMELPLAANVCNQTLREIDRNPDWSMAHVTMNPSTQSLLHKHKKMYEVYMVTKGRGNLVIRDNIFEVQEGSVMVIYPDNQHKLTNTGLLSLEHLVIAAPPFDPEDVFLVNERFAPSGEAWPYDFPTPQDCFDGAKIISYGLPEINSSIALGCVINDPNRRKSPHYHKISREWIFVVEGNGLIVVNGQSTPISSGNWIEIEPGEYHALRNYNDQYLIVACICTPAFQMDDVYY